MVSNPGFRSGNAKRDSGINRLHRCRRKLVPLAASSLLHRGMKQALLKLVIVTEYISDCTTTNRSSTVNMLSLKAWMIKIDSYLFMLLNRAFSTENTASERYVLALLE